MHHSTILAVLSLVLSTAAHNAQTPFSTPDGPASTLKKKPLTGRFMHITDFHPDPLYKVGATIESGCHTLPKGKGKALMGGVNGGEEIEGGEPRKEGIAGKWGTGVSDCDSPMSLVNMTMDWLAKEWAHEVDFVVWTGDSARHDLDRTQPRTPKEIFHLNRVLVEKMQQAFPDVPIVPSIGNNDIYPHNILAPGPNAVMTEYTKIWEDFIPNDFEHIFEKGGYFSLEVIPDRLAVISLNTLYWYRTNTLADGCLDRTKDPGAFELEWLEVQLDQFRERGMQVWLSGHVPPHLGMYFDNCYLKYGDLALRYQDTILGHLFGHMNVDHFFFIDVDELEAGMIHLQSTNYTGSLRPDDDDEIFIDGPMPRQGPLLPGSSRYRTMGRSINNGLQDELKKDFGEMPGPANIKLKDYTVVNVAPSIIPTYFPGVRVFSYNITDVEDDALWADMLKKKKKHRTGHRHKKKKPKDDCKLPKNQDKPHCVFRRLPRYYDKNSPSRRNGPLSPLGYTQFFLPDVDTKSDHPPEWEIEYSTFRAEALLPPPSTPSNVSETGSRGFEQPLPVPIHLLPGYDSSFIHLLGGDAANGDGVEAATVQEFVKGLKKITPWRLKDLTIKNYIKLARKLVQQKKSWKKFRELMYVSSDVEK